jgi:hypothetical protein
MKKYKRELPRRDFLLESALVCGALVLGGCSHSRLRRVSGEGGIDSDYYISRKERLLKDFDELKKSTRVILASRYGNDFGQTIDADARREFDLLIPQIPYVGGDENALTREMIQSAMALALFRAMKNQGKTTEETGKLLYNTVESMADSYPRLLARTVGFYEMSRFGQRKSRNAAAESQKRLYPANWVFTFVEGDGEDFDWGIDYVECGIVKFYHAQGADELTPYLCLADFPMSEALGMGLNQTTTIAEGHEKCNFRFKRGRATQQGWPPVFLNHSSV